MSNLRELVESDSITIAPAVFNAMSALLAARAGFKALYVGGGTLGYIDGVTEANLTLPDFVQVALSIRTVCNLPLILDGAGGWGDPMHMHRTIGLSEAAGFSAIEIEDQLLPKRVHHHVGIDHVIPAEMMVAKIRECVTVRRSTDFLIIARTNTARESLDEALRRGEAYLRAGADMLFIPTTNADYLRAFGERLGGPLMHMVAGDGMATLPFSIEEFRRLGYRIIADAHTPMLSAYQALKGAYAAIAGCISDPTLSDGAAAILDDLHETIGLERLLEVERRTVELPTS